MLPGPAELDDAGAGAALLALHPAASAAASTMGPRTGSRARPLAELRFRLINNVSLGSRGGHLPPEAPTGRDRLPRRPVVNGARFAISLRSAAKFLAAGRCLRHLQRRHGRVAPGIRAALDPARSNNGRWLFARGTGW